ncbi:hypothetical protein [Butyrivibrio proteoclasticus]|nr:hypothetical protein [Butyrivibrio proteoclasticus]
MDERAMAMNDNELENITGGGKGKSDQTTGERTTEAYCPICKKTTTFIVYSGSRGKCKKCGEMSQI